MNVIPNRRGLLLGALTAGAAASVAAIPAIVDAENRPIRSLDYCRSTKPPGRGFLRPKPAQTTTGRSSRPAERSTPPSRRS
jgi:hypothetical protein